MTKERVVTPGRSSSRHACPVCGRDVGISEPLCFGCSSQLGDEARREVRRSWHKIRSGQATPLHLAEFGDYCREEVRRELATKGAQRW